ncbi:hypothetical protein S83_066071, partial [Arachis hypogaea]
SHKKMSAKMIDYMVDEHNIDIDPELLKKVKGLCITWKRGDTFGGNRGLRPVPPEKSIFPLDHMHLCDLVIRKEKKEYLGCLKTAVLNGKYKRLEHKAEEKVQALKEIRETVNHRNHIDGSVKLISTSLFGVPKVKQQF